MATAAVSQALAGVSMRPAKATLPTRSGQAAVGPEDDFRGKVGAAIDRARTLRGWNLDELSHACRRDPRQVAKWISGLERPQFDVLFAVETFRKPLVIALAELAGQGVEIDTVIRLRLKESA